MSSPQSSVLLSGLQSAQPSAFLDLMEKRLNRGGGGGQREGRMRIREGERDGEEGEEKGQKEKKNLEAPPWRGVSHAHVLLGEWPLPLY